MAVTALRLNNPNNDNTGLTYSASDERQLLAALQTPGIVGSFAVEAGKRVNGKGLEVTVTGNPEAISVAPGVATVSDVARSSLAAYLVSVSTIEIISLSGVGRPGTGQSRIDLVILRVRDVDAGLGSVRSASVERIAGDVGTTPSAPAMPAMSLLLATLTVPQDGQAISVTQNTARTVAAGGIRPILSTSARSAIAAWSGRTVFNEQNASIDVYDGSRWGSVAVMPAVRLLRRTANQTVATGGINVPLNAGWSPQPGDMGDECGITYAEGIATVSKAGMYSILLRFIVPALTTGTWSVGIYVNDVDPIAANPVDYNKFDQEARGTSLSYQAQIPLEAGDRLKAFVRSSNDTQTINTGSTPNRWEIRRVG